ncbi:alpha/beta hydrolase [Pleurocapsales cyanobacterium LEGE 10410]|nr:alpha/beta hydrolase [Pleurocapsales cyanobacterium LEGE 10410]
MIALFSCSFISTVSILPAVSADRIAFSYGALGEFYISIADLEIFATEGKVTRSFAYYADRLSKQDLAKLRDLLNQSFDINQITVSTFLNLPIGKQLIKEIGLIIDSPSRISQPALRGSLILAASEPEGLTILNVLRLYSTKTLKLNTKRIMEAVDEGTKLLADTERVFQALEREAAIGAKIDDTIDVNTLANLKKSGSKKWHRETLVIKAGDRQTEGVVYLPKATKQPVPLVVIAPGLNNNWQNFAYLAEHLASYGFGVAAVNFPGTNAHRINAISQGLDTPPPDNQWVEQPKVITQLLDEIERKSQSDRSWQGKLDLQRVGVIGQSLGGYTAIASAGAKVDWQHLQQECRQFENSDRLNLNPALYWQCQGAKDTPPDTDLQDQRIVAAIAVNPVTNPIFSQQGMNKLKSPLMIVTGDADLVAPALDEQLEPFTWLPNTNKYLVMVKNSTHFSFIGEETEEIELSSETVDSNLVLARSYLKVLSVAFFKTYLVELGLNKVSIKQLKLCLCKSI